MLARAALKGSIAVGGGRHIERPPQSRWVLYLQHTTKNGRKVADICAECVTQRVSKAVSDVPSPPDATVIS